ncbi:hypothetical protein LX87_05182 [Larkinella arboricola]|uniref:Uncharacterized protein n=1 Tax=Larkinella arboricola TaxID=643671 RepID=A0A327WM62_LARAB|nr:hypothetical protein [Larkinella arboricola]RAJ92214.1 hypothetical protein LX87_05182 [Larkinella arboricola]
MSFKTLFLIGALEVAFLLALVLKVAGILKLSWIWVLSPVWLPIAGILLAVVLLVVYLAAVALISFCIHCLKPRSNQ